MGGASSGQAAESKSRKVSRSRVSFFFYPPRGSRGAEAAQDEVGFVFDDPLDEFAFGELHRLGDGRGEVNVPLFGRLAADELDFGRVAHGDLLCLVI